MQIFGVLDALDYYNGRLGVLFHHNGDPTWNDFPADYSFPVKIKLWAPTAQSASLLLFNKSTDTVPEKTVRMHSHNGVWVADGDYDGKGKYYLFKVNVFVASAQAIVSNTTTDPYCIDLCSPTTPPAQAHTIKTKSPGISTRRPHAHHPVLPR